MKLSLKNKQRASSSERQANARGSTIKEKRSATDSSPSHAEISSPLDRDFTSLLRTKVQARIEAEKAHSSALSRIDFLEKRLADGEPPKGLKIRTIKAKGKDAALQAKFDEILKEAELKLLGATIESLKSEIPPLTDAVEKRREDINTTIAKWRSTFPLKDSASVKQADSLVKSAQNYTNDLYFSCIVSLTSKSLAESLKKEEKARKQANMETEFQLTESSIREIVRQEVKRSADAKPKKGQTKPSQQTQTRTKNKAQQRRSRSSTRKRTVPNRSRSQHKSSMSKNSRSRGFGHGT